MYLKNEKIIIKRNLKMYKKDIVAAIVNEKFNPKKTKATAFAPANIALCKYWGKRDSELNLPYSSSISISLANKGVTTSLSLLENANRDQIILNQQPVSLETTFAKRVIDFLDLVRPHPQAHFLLDTSANIPIAAGVASSASGFAALAKALNELFDWQLEERQLSIMARLGSGSACRSLWNGFVEWHAGYDPSGMDSFAELLPEQWQELRVGLLILSKEEKKISSRTAMQQTLSTSTFYTSWLAKADQDLTKIKDAIKRRDFASFGAAVESNALAMHGIMQTSWPPIFYSLPETVSAFRKIWDLREKGKNIFFTQDAGPNLKLLFLSEEIPVVREVFPEIEILEPFDANLVP
jgi:diphosphomevalonate decarboxylase